MKTRRGQIAIVVASVIVLAIVVGPGRVGVARALPLVRDANPGSPTIPYAGTLSDPTGKPVADGSYDFSFALYDSETGGEAFWFEIQEGVSVEAGAFEVALGSKTPLPEEALEGGERWLAAAVRGREESAFTDLLPRQRLSGGLVAAPDSPTITGTCPHDHLGEEWSTTINWSLGAFKIYNYGNGPSIWGWNGGGGNALRGYATGTGLGVYGESIDNAGVVGRSTTGNGVEGYTPSSSKYGVYGKNESGSGTGVYGEGSGYGVYSKGSLYVQGNIYASGSKAGYVVDIAQNDDLVPLEAGDLVVISGAGAPVLGDIPVIQVRRATTRGTSAIVGVVDKRFSIEPAGKAGDEITRISTDDEPINPGDYLTIVTLGAFKAIKVDASYGAIAPGDLLVASPNPGYAMHADSPQAGSIFGKALEALPSGTGLIPVMVDLQ